MTKKRLSKSQYVKGLQCEKALWLYRNRPELRGEIDDATQAIFDTGHSVGELAKALYPRGVEVKAEYFDIDGAVNETHAYIESGEKAIFEACAMTSDELYSRIDLLVKVRGKEEWDLIEVKSSSGVKDYHYDDLAFQYYVFSQSGYKIRKAILMHIDSSFIKDGEIDPKKFFVKVDLTSEVISLQVEVEAEAKNLQKTLRKRTEPQINIGSQCFSPFECEFSSECFKCVPEYSVFNIFSGRKLEKLMEQEIYDLENIPDYIQTTTRKQSDIDAYLNDEIILDKDGLKAWLKNVSYPLHFLDYETMNPAIPLYDGMSPYKQYPFQFSCHIQKTPRSKLEHVEFLGDSTKDPRADFVKELIKACGKEGSIVVYNQGFESGVNRRLMEDFPKKAKQLQKINDRMIDLLVPFRSRYLYSPSQQSSASIKAVLPAFVDDLNYKDLEIQEGGTASSLFAQSCIEKMSDIDEATLRKNLLEYCKLDTLAMVKLLEVVKKYSN